jgi:hypothetical protein
MKIRFALALPAVIVLSLAALPASAGKNPERNAYFGETHIHTSWSFDSYAFGTTKTGPEDFYKYALGQPIPHPGGYNVRITQPLDWGAATEHAEYLGAFTLANDPDSPLSTNHPVLAWLLKFGGQKNALTTYKLLAITLVKNLPIDALQSPEAAGTVWRKAVEIADQYDRPGVFTTFAAYEWTSTPNSKNLHRNIFFKDSKKIPEMPFSAVESSVPMDLWSWMDDQRKAGNELLAISHNSNLSDGLMFPTEVDGRGRPIDKAWSETRVRNEPLAELKQVKGQSETTPLLSPTDEFAGYEVLTWLLLGQTGEPKQYGSYIRQAYRDGLGMQSARGFNPYTFGVVSGSDAHVSATPYRQQNFFGPHGLMDATPEKRLSSEKFLNLDNRMISPAGLSVVWAEENTREAIFAAMQRKETYATSGVRIQLRLFGGWEYGQDLLKQKAWVKTAYAKGVPMGGDLPAAKANVPSFVVWAVKDPASANLDRIQIVKGWSKNGQTFEKIYDVAWSGKRTPDPATGKVPPIGSTVDLTKATYTNTIGAVELKTVWTDPDFDASLDAFYYARVLEIPTPRWTTIQARALGMMPPDGFHTTIQERAWSSPIWFSPTAEARKSVKPGVTVADLEQNGAVALNDAQLKELVVGKTLKVYNTVTGQRFELLYGTDGRRLMTAVDRKTPELDGMGELSHGRQTQYEIRDGHIVTEAAGTPFDETVYKMGDKYVAARSHEFGYANYEVEVVR